MAKKIPDATPAPVQASPRPAEQAEARGYQFHYATEPPPAIVEAGKAIYWSMARVLGELAKAGIAKTRENREQHFNFRGIDEVMNAVAPLFSRFGVLVFPEVQERVVTERLSKQGNVMFNVAMRVEFTFVSALDGSRHSAILAGEATDSGDKATNKAEAAAFKYCLLQTFCVPLEGEGEDADATTNEASVPKPPDGYTEFLTRASAAAGKGTRAMRDAWKASANGERVCWQFLVEKDAANWKLVKGKAEDIDATITKTASESIKNEGRP